jgi:hypothetical protein
MKTLIRNLMKSIPSQQGFRVTIPLRQTPHPVADEAIAAWSEFMGRESAELWVAATAMREKPQAHGQAGA